ncbi:hypothetical protein [Streptomyces sp. NPDC052225]|uniref:hypothetical protein n=1 Tax=Streptomyces sp. NPDC052225 TaxID=3154949 RepID=UPI00342467B4
MSLRFIGIDPDTKTGDSPTVWIDEERGELVLQGWKPSAALEAECAAFEVPGHAVGIPDNEAVVRIPARMTDMIREACSALERTDDR